MGQWQIKKNRSSLAEWYSNVSSTSRKLISELLVISVLLYIESTACTCNCLCKNKNKCFNECGTNLDMLYFQLYKYHIICNHISQQQVNQNVYKKHSQL